MNKNEFIAAVCDDKTLEALHLPKGTVAQVIEACFTTIEQALKKGEEVRLVGFGNFYVSERAAGKVHNPRGGGMIETKASRQPKFRAGKRFKDEVNGVVSE